MTERTPLVSLRKKDFKITHIRGTGPGGQHKNKKRTGVRIEHPSSGAVGVATESRSQATNMKKAFERMADSQEMRVWLRIESARASVGAAEWERRINKRVEEMMRPDNILVEVGDGTKWKREDVD